MTGVLARRRGVMAATSEGGGGGDGGGGTGGTVAAGPTFVPSDLASLALWFKADAIAGAVDNDPVTQWDDQSGNGRHASQATAAKQPLYKTGVQNGLPAVRFDGTDDFLLTSTFASALAQPNAIFVVAKWGGSRSYLVDGTGTSRNAIGYEFTSGSAKMGIYAGTARENGARPTTTELFEVQFLSGADQFRYRGGLVLNADAGAQSLGALTVGAGNGGGFGWLAGDICEIVVCDASLTVAEQWQIEQYLSDKWHVNAPRRRNTPLTTPTYDGSGQAVHASVIDFSNQYGQATWNGYRYWMAMTPYPNSDATKENPSILVSADGEAWTVPTGLTNPIDSTPATGHNSDACLTYDHVNGVLYCYYRETNGTDYIQVRSSTDGVTWSGETTVFSVTADSALSPAVIFDGTTWHCWVVDYNADPNTIVYRSSTSPTTGWSAGTVCTATPPTGKDFWHLTVFVDPRDGTYHSFLTVQNSGANTTETDLCLMRSTDGLTWSVSDLVMEDVIYPTAWDATGVYLASGHLKDEDTYDIWYSGVEGTTWRIGRGELSTWEAPALP